VLGYRSAIEAHLLPVFGSMPVESVTISDIEHWIATVDRSPSHAQQADRAAPRDPRAGPEGLRPAAEPRCRGREVPAAAERRIEVYSPEEVWVLVRAAASSQDAAIYLTAASPACAGAS
jgi:hypothetical protein